MDKTDISSRERGYSRHQFYRAQAQILRKQAKRRLPYPENRPLILLMCALGAFFAPFAFKSRKHQDII
jgi:hypothetical protein